ncbi:MAG: hypothetical protein V7637_6096 [Mycobacteriales bacterium]|jgi:hypothetical protein
MTSTAEELITADFGVADLTGRWRSPYASEVFPGIWGIDDFWLQSPFWGIHFNSYKEPECQNRLFELFIMGAWELGDANPDVPGARDANFSRVKVGLTLYDQWPIGAANEAGSGSRPWQLNDWQDVSLGGCPPIDLPGIDNCPMEYDLLGMARVGVAGGGDRLYFGQRQHDEDGSGICNRRAPGLLPYYVVRVTGAAPNIGHGANFGAPDWFNITRSLTPAVPRSAG